MCKCCQNTRNKNLGCLVFTESILVIYSYMTVYCNSSTVKKCCSLVSVYFCVLSVFLGISNNCVDTSCGFLFFNIIYTHICPQNLSVLSTTYVKVLLSSFKPAKCPRNYLCFLIFISSLSFKEKDFRSKLGCFSVHLSLSLSCTRTPSHADITDVHIPCSSHTIRQTP